VLFSLAGFAFIFLLLSLLPLVPDKYWMALFARQFPEAVPAAGLKAIKEQLDEDSQRLPLS
jgi:Na+-transporting methylmalonyl-CoA/oxaloacetate decarboxylase gamma subunit